MSKHPIFLSEILPAPNDICLINSNVFEPMIKSIFFISDYFLPKPRSGSKYNFRQYKDDIVNAFVKAALDARIPNKGI